MTWYLCLRQQPRHFLLNLRVYVKIRLYRGNSSLCTSSFSGVCFHHLHSCRLIDRRCFNCKEAVSLRPKKGRRDRKCFIPFLDSFSASRFAWLSLWFPLTGVGVRTSRRNEGRRREKKSSRRKWRRRIERSWCFLRTCIGRRRHTQLGR